MEEENRVSETEEKKVSVPNANPYHKDRGEDDEETKAFLTGKLSKYHQEQRDKKCLDYLQAQYILLHCLYYEKRILLLLMMNIPN